MFRFKRMAVFIFIITWISPSSQASDAERLRATMKFDSARGVFIIRYPMNLEGEMREMIYEPRNKVKANVKLGVERVKSLFGADKYEYRYDISNDAKSEQPLMSIAMKFRKSIIPKEAKNVLGSRVTDDGNIRIPVGMKTKDADGNEITENIDIAEIAIPPLDVGSIKYPAFSLNNITSDGIFWVKVPMPIVAGETEVRIAWFAARKFLEPGGQAGVFSFKSANLPGIVEMEFTGIPRTPPPTFVPPDDELDDEGILIAGFEQAHELYASISKNHFAGVKSVGPIPPIVNDPVAECDTFISHMISLVRSATDLGWIKHDLRKGRNDDGDHGKRKGDEKGVDKDDEGEDDGDGDDLDTKDKGLPGAAKSIIKKLTKVRRECLRGQFGGAREKLRALIKQVNAQRGKHLTEEAYVLIKFNAEFLLEKI